jgi:hypothetical protein
MSRRALLLSVPVLLSLAAAAHASAETLPEASAEPSYPLDAIPRDIPNGQPFGCPDVDLVDYRGDTIRFLPTVKVYSGFRERLEKFERVAQEVGKEVYGRGPTWIHNLGAYSCRRMTAHPRLLSEHALGNAVDVAGFDFGPLPRNATLPPGLDRGFTNGFEVRVLKHWRSKSGHAAVHARFLKTLARRLIARKDIFRVILGPGYPGHRSHFHFDMATFRLAGIFEDGRVLTGDPGPAAVNGSEPQPPR